MTEKFVVVVRRPVLVRGHRGVHHHEVLRRDRRVEGLNTHVFMRYLFLFPG